MISPYVKLDAGVRADGFPGTPAPTGQPAFTVIFLGLAFSALGRRSRSTPS